MLTNGLRKSFISEKIYDQEKINVIKEEEETNKKEIESKDTILNIIGYNIRSMRKEQKYTISQLATKAGISAKYLQGVEVGKRNISVTNLNKVARVLDVELVVFFRNIDPEKSKKLFSISSKLKRYNLDQLKSIEFFIKNFEDLVHDSDDKDIIDDTDI